MATGSSFLGSGASGVSALRQFWISLGLETNVASFVTGFELVKLLEGSLKSLAVGLAHAIGAIPKMVEETAELGKKAQLAAEKTGLSTDAVQELAFVAERANLSFKDFTYGISTMLRHVDELRHGKTTEGAKALQRLGLSAQTLIGPDGAFVGTDVALRQIITGMGKLPDASEKSRIAFSAFGRAGQNMIPFLIQGNAAIDELRQQAREYGVILSEEAVKASLDFSHSLGDLQHAAKGLKFAISGPLMPVLEKFIRTLTDFIQSNREIISDAVISFFKRFVKVLTEVLHFAIAFYNATRMIVKTIDAWHDAFVERFGPALGNLLSVLIAFGTAFVIFGWKTFWAGLRAAAGFLLPVAAIALLILALDDMIGWMEGKDSVIGAFVDRWQKALEKWSEGKASDPWWLLALKQFVLLISNPEKFFNQFVQAFKDAFNGLLDWLEDALIGIWNRIIGDKIPGMHVDTSGERAAKGSTIDEERSPWARAADFLPPVAGFKLLKDMGWALGELGSVFGNGMGPDEMRRAFPTFFNSPFVQGANPGNTTVTITIQTPAGMDAKDLATHTRDVWDDWEDARNRHLHNAVGP